MMSLQSGESELDDPSEKGSILLHTNIHHTRINHPLLSSFLLLASLITVTSPFYSFFSLSLLLLISTQVP